MGTACARFSRNYQERGPKGSNQIKFLWNHDLQIPVGVLTELKEDDIGLLEARILRTPKGDELLDAVRRRYQS